MDQTARAEFLLMKVLQNSAALVRMATRIDCTVAGASLKDGYLCTVGPNDFL